MTPLSRDDFATVSDPVRPGKKKKSQSKYRERDHQGDFIAASFPAILIRGKRNRWRYRFINE